MLILACQAIGWIRTAGRDERDERDDGRLSLRLRDRRASLLLLLAATRMILAGTYEVGAAGRTAYESSGGFGLALTVLALYGGAALGLEDAHQHDVLPLFRRKAAADSFAGYERRLERLDAEAGVRQQLSRGSD